MAWRWILQSISLIDLLCLGTSVLGLSPSLFLDFIPVLYNYVAEVELASPKGPLGLTAL